MEDKFNVSVKAEPLFSIGGFNITNSMVTTVVVGIILLIIVLTAANKAKLIPSRWQALWELIVEFLLGIAESSLGRKTGRAFFPLLATFFIYIFVANWFSLLPGIGTIGKYETEIQVPQDKTVALTQNGFAQAQSVLAVTDASGKSLGELPVGTYVKIKSLEGNRAEVQPVHDIGEEAAQPVEGMPEGFVQSTQQLLGATQYRVLIPFLRAPNADLNMTLAMALVIIILVQIIAVRSHGFLGYIKEFFPKPYVLDPLLTPIEIVAQFARLISLSIRLFGNVFAGEALLAIIIRLLAPSLFIFIGLELFFGLIQALVFFSLSTVYLTLAISGSEGEHGPGEHEPQAGGEAHLTEQAQYPQQSAAH